jgi:hypothetical protein
LGRRDREGIGGEREGMDWARRLGNKLGIGLGFTGEAFYTDDAVKRMGGLDSL